MIKRDLTRELHVVDLHRVDGQSAVAAAAIQSGESLMDEATGKSFTPLKPDLIDHAEIAAPADTPAWVFDRQLFWSRASQAEKRYDSRLARLISGPLPERLPLADRIRLVREFVTAAFLADGMVVDWALHAPSNYSFLHGAPIMHVMLPTRKVIGSGFGPKIVEWQGRPYVHRFQAEWISRLDAANDRFAAKAASMVA